MTGSYKSAPKRKVTIEEVSQLDSDDKPFDPPRHKYRVVDADGNQLGPLHATLKGARDYCDANRLDYTSGSVPG